MDDEEEKTPLQLLVGDLSALNAEIEADYAVAQESFTCSECGDEHTRFDGDSDSDSDSDSH